MDAVIKFGLSEGQDVLLEYDNGSHQSVHIEQTQVTNDRMGVRAIPQDTADTFYIIIDTSNTDDEPNGFPLYRQRSLTDPMAGDHIPEPLPEQVPHRRVRAITRPDPQPIETA